MFGFTLQASFGEIGQLNYKEGRYVSKTGGIFMVTATFHVRTEILVIPGKKMVFSSQLL